MSGKGSNSNRSSDGGYSVQIIVAVIGLISAVAVAYLAYLQVVKVVEIPIQTTQTAEAALTLVAGLTPPADEAPSEVYPPEDTPTTRIDTPTVMPSFTATPGVLPSGTPTPTAMPPAPTSTFTPILTPTFTPMPVQCPIAVEQGAEITFWGPSNAADEQVYLDLIQRFEAVCQVRVNSTFSPELETRLVIALDAGDAPDVAQLPVDSAGPFAGNTLLEMDEYLPPDVEGVVQKWQPLPGGKTYGLIKRWGQVAVIGILPGRYPGAATAFAIYIGSQ